MTAYAIAQVHSVEFGPDIVEYLERIDATLDPFGGRFIVHGGAYETVEGRWGTGGTIVIAFPDFERARAWWDSPAYQEILPLRTRHMVADIILIDGVPGDGYRGADSLKY
ncbi:hypothetical protein GCM10018790_81870 [Kitasatospora xanthocidica]|uniref:DUF1330 domain-containing protein n=1 Tax=Kitasatospora xanthocidica TaxID=83382 RepID=UPI001672AE4F|nr:DUF1330 domain-containing protein [Kitasatospora xanthocidica]GHF92509.1 hypothetical protein GCM10018790_81870 [Kitasatospora xanthocidica]